MFNQEPIEQLRRDMNTGFKTYDERFKLFGEDQKSIKDEIKLMKENHLAHIETDMSKMQTNLEWLIKYHWIIATAAIGALVASLINLTK